MVALPRPQLQLASTLPSALVMFRNGRKPAHGNLVILVTGIHTIPSVVFLKERAVTIATVRIVHAVWTLPVTDAAPHRLMIAAELVRGFVALKVAAPRLTRITVVVIEVRF